jgi:purine-cytosine permease-like protein
MEDLQRLHEIPTNEIYDTRSFDKRTGDSEVKQDDYALRRVPGTWRWSAWEALWAHSGISTAMAYPITAALLSVAYGAPSMIVALIITLLYTGVGVYYTVKKSSQEGTSNDLMSRHTFGFHGSAFQTVLYGLLGTIYFSIETHVMSASLSEAIPILPYWLSAAIVCIAFIPLTYYGMVFMAKLQGLTVWIYVLGIILAIVGLFGGWAEQANSALAGSSWWNVNPNHVEMSWISVLGAMGAFIGILGSIQILLVTDTARFIKVREKKKGGILYTLIGVTVPTLLTPLFGIYLLAATAGTNPDPGVTFVWLLGPIGLFFVIITQIRCNVINVYFGTNALENFTSQLFKLNWKRTIFLIPFMVISYIILVSPFLNYFGTIMTMLSVFLFNYVSVLFGDWLLVRKKYNIPQWSEFRRGYLPKYNKIGMYSMWIPTIVGVVMASGMFGIVPQVLAVPVTGIAAFIMPGIIAAMMSKETVVKQYFARIPVRLSNVKDHDGEHQCAACNNTYHMSDFVVCPFHNGKQLCSNCCSSERSCNSMCHTETADVPIVENVPV